MSCVSSRVFIVAILGAYLIAFTALADSPGTEATPRPPGAPAAAPLNWQSPARWRHGLKKTSGTLTLSVAGVEFHPVGGPPLRWPFKEIQTFELASHRLNVTGYENRRWRLYGERSFQFDLADAVPPAVAAELAERVAKPAKNGVPDAAAPAFATLGARHRTRDGGTDGILRFADSGIDYVTTTGRGARRWRWADIQTLAYPDAYHFRVGAYREIFEFELKQPMPRELFDRLWDDLYARDLHGLDVKGGTRP